MCLLRNEGEDEWHASVLKCPFREQTTLRRETALEVHRLEGINAIKNLRSYALPRNLKASSYELEFLFNLLWASEHWVPGRPISICTAGAVVQRAWPFVLGPAGKSQIQHARYPTSFRALKARSESEHPLLGPHLIPRHQKLGLSQTFWKHSRFWMILPQL